MIRKLLILDKGLSAVRVIRTCKEQGIKTLVFYDKNEINELHVRYSDVKILLKNSINLKDYNLIINIALNQQIDAVYPGLGIFCNDQKLTKICKENNIVFIDYAQEAEYNFDSMYYVFKNNNISYNLATYIFCLDVQVAADKQGNIFIINYHKVFLRNSNDEVFSETFYPNSKNDLMKIEKINKKTIEIIKKIKFIGIGSVRYICDFPNMSYEFLKIIPNLQTSHAIVEAIYHVDLVDLQFKIFMGVDFKNFFSIKRIPLLYCIQCNINAEDPEQTFKRSYGQIEEIYYPGGFGVRLDNIAFKGYCILPCNNRTISSLTVLDRNKLDLRSKFKVVLSEYVLSGVNYNVDFLLSVIPEK